MSGQLIGHYRIVEKIGSGAMGEVFRARDERLGRDVALKLIRPASSANPDHLRRFELEARAAAALNHPNIVVVYDVGFSEGTPFIVCELLKGATLRKQLLEGPLPVRVAVDYSLQIVQGLVAAHDRRIVHRDLKPENLFVTTDQRIKILDFGVAKLQSAPEESGRAVEELTTVTRTGAVVGTVAYMSPEQLRGKAVDHRSDLFSVGAILYEMLSGCRAFRGETEVDTITSVLKDDPPEINLEERNVPLAFRQIVRHCLEKEPERRFQSARDLAFALETLSETSTGRLTRRVAPRKDTKIAWAAAGVLLVATVLLFLNQLRHETVPPTYRRLTFDDGAVYSARFASDFKAVVYTAAWNGRPLQIFSTVGDSLLSQPFTLTDANLLAISRTGELAVNLRGEHRAHREIEGGMLARTPPAGGSPREILNDVPWADWDPKGELAVAHRVQGRDRLEYPIGHTLFQSEGWISHLRFSPQADKIAFIDHPTLHDDRGYVVLLDLSGRASKLSPEWESADGLAWSSDGKEVWFTAAKEGLNRGLMAATLSGRVRQILDLTSGMTLQDIAPDGRVLVSVDDERIAMATTARDGKPSDISWRDWSIAKDISPDGQSVLFEESGESAGANYSLGIRKIDGTPPIQLGEGSAGGLSPDGKWAISILPGSPGQVKLIPIGPGQPRTIPTSGLEIENGTARFLADGKRISLDAKEPGHGARTYVVDLDGGKPVPVTPEGIFNGLVSTNGRYVVAADDTGKVSIYPMAGGAARSIPGLEPGLVPLRWSEDDSAVYGYHRNQVPIKVYKVNVASGEMTLIQQLQPETINGVVYIAPIVVNRDGSRFAYSYYRVFSMLYLISGLR